MPGKNLLTFVFFLFFVLTTRPSMWTGSKTAGRRAYDQLRVGIHGVIQGNLDLLDLRLENIRLLVFGQSNQC